MRKFIINSFIFLSVSLQAFSATNMQEIFEATMDVAFARYNFEGVAQVTLKLVKQGDTATNILVEFKNGEQDVFYDLSVTDAQPDESGCMNYYASLKSENPDVLFGQRFSVNLIDYSTCNHSDIEAGIWQASLRSGHGWCGTLDSTMELRGNPRA